MSEDLAPGPLLDPSLVETTLRVALAKGGEWAELFAEDRQSASSSFDEGRVDSMSSSRDRGVGIRVTVGEITGFAHTSDLSSEGLKEAAEVAASAATSSSRTTAVALNGDGLASTRVKMLPNLVSKESLSLIHI